MDRSPRRGRIEQGGVRSFRFQLIVSFVLVSILPIEFVHLASYYNTASTLRENVHRLIDANLHQTRKSLDTVLTSYEDLLFQIYTDDEIVEQLNNINAGRDVALSINVLRRRLQGLAGAKPGVQCLTLVPSRGRIISYDKLSPTSLESSWLGTDEAAIAEAYRTASEHRKTWIFADGRAILFGGSPYYLFHMARRVVDYRRIHNDVGVVFLSVDESVLSDVCNDEVLSGSMTSVSFLKDSRGLLVSFPDRSLIGSPAGGDYGAIVRRAVPFGNGPVAVRSLPDERTGWTIVSVADLSGLFSRIQAQQRITAVTGLLASFLLVAIIVLMTDRLSASVSTVARSMQLAGGGDLSVRIVPDRRMPQEIRTIASGFNEMTTKLKLLVEEVRKTETRLLEAQINPHFLYNTLDTINWMAIDREEYEISDMINALARILRYGVDRNNAIVTVADEIDWLRQYVLLHQTRLKYTFSYDVSVEETVLGYRLHKLLLQPFVENAIIHGFADMAEGGSLGIGIAEEAGALAILITDNGRGFPPDVVERINQRGEAVTGQEGPADAGDPAAARSGIGIENARHRLNMYYGEQAGLSVVSRPGDTRVRLWIPLI